MNVILNPVVLVVHSCNVYFLNKAAKHNANLIGQIAEVGMDLCPPRKLSKESFATDDLQLPEAAVDAGETASITRDVADDIRLCFR